MDHPIVFLEPMKIEIRKKQIQAFQDGYNQCSQDVQADMDDNVILTEVIFEYVNVKTRTAEYIKKLNGGKNGQTKHSPEAIRDSQEH